MPLLSYTFCNECEPPAFELQIVSYGGYRSSDQVRELSIAGAPILDSGTFVPDNSLLPWRFKGELDAFRDTAVKFRPMLHLEYPRKDDEECADLESPITYDLDPWDLKLFWVDDGVGDSTKIFCGACPGEAPFCSTKETEENTALADILDALAGFDWSQIPVWSNIENNAQSTAQLFYDTDASEFSPQFIYSSYSGVSYQSPTGYGHLPLPEGGIIPFGLSSFFSPFTGDVFTQQPPFPDIGSTFISCTVVISRPRVRMLVPCFCRLVTINADGSYTTVLPTLLEPRVYQPGEIAEPIWDAELFKSQGMPSVLMVVEPGTDACL